MAGARALTDQEIESTLTHLKSSRDKCLFILGINTGFRINELLSIKYSDIFKNNRIVDVLCVPRRHIKAKSQGRSIVLNRKAKIALELCLLENKYKYDDHMFKIKRAQAHNILKQAFELAGIGQQRSTHSMRKTFAHRMYEKLGHDLLATQKALGHAFIDTTAKYIEINQEKIDAAILQES